MKRVILKSISLTNFKGHKDLIVNFNNETKISGANATGKSTVFDAFVWILFGKDQFDRKDFEIIPTVGGRQLDRVESEVFGIFNIDGTELHLRRVLRQRWVRRRGTAEEVFDGCETLFYVNGVPKKAGEYKAIVDSIIDETVFKLITNPATFLGLHWTKQREFLFQIAGTISDSEIAASNPEFSKLLDMINGKSFADFKKELSAMKKKLKDDLDNIQPRIDQTTKLMPESVDFGRIDSDIKSIDEEIAGIDLQLSDRAAAIRGQYEHVQSKQKQIDGLKTKQRDIVNRATEEAQKAVFNSNQSRNQLFNKKTEKQAELTSANEILRTAKLNLSQLKDRHEDLQKDIVELRKNWIAENEKEYAGKSGCLICPAFGNQCSDPHAIEKHEQSKDAALAAFIDAKNKKLDDINQRGGKLTEVLEAIKLKIAASADSVTKAEDAVKAIESEIKTITETINTTPIATAEPVKVDSLPEWLSIQTEIEEIDLTIAEVKPVDNTDLQQHKSELMTKRDDLKKQLSAKDLIIRYNQEIVNLQDQGKNLAQQIADLEKQEFTIAEFTKVKITESERRINSLFQIVQFKLFDKTIDGNEFECCIATNKNGVPIAATNTAEKVNAGMDIIATLSRFYNVSAPIFADGAESVNDYLNTGSQMVYLKVTREPSLVINY